MGRLRCVVDTNVLISAALLPDRTPAHAVGWVLRHGVLLASEATFRELDGRLRRPKFDRYLDDEDREAYLALIREASLFVTVHEAVRASPDPTDDAFLDLAVSGGADCILTGDTRHLPPLHPFRGIPILTPAQFVESVRHRDRG